MRAAIAEKDRGCTGRRGRLSTFSTAQSKFTTTVQRSRYASGPLGTLFNWARGSKRELHFLPYLVPLAHHGVVSHPTPPTAPALPAPSLDNPA